MTRKQKRLKGARQLRRVVLELAIELFKAEHDRAVAEGLRALRKLLHQGRSG